MTAMIESINLTKHFGSIKAVEDLTFQVEKGEVLGFLGPNGAGKSTTMKMLTCFVAPTSGTAKVRGHDILQEPMAVRQVVGYLPESAPAYSEMSPLGFLQFVARVRGYSGRELRSAVDRILTTCALEEVRHQPFETLSKGYKRRVCLAQALIHDPEVLIMDEPTDGLDPNQKHEVRQLIKRMAGGKVIILSTHILEEVDAVCTRAVIIAHGRLVADGKPDELKQRSRHHGAVTLTLKGGDKSTVEAALIQVRHVKRVEWLDGTSGGSLRLKVYPEHARTIAPEVAQMLRQRGWEVDQLVVEEGHLDEVFRQLTQAEHAPAGERS